MSTAYRVMCGPCAGESVAVGPLGTCMLGCPLAHCGLCGSCGAPPAPVGSQASWGHGPNPALGRMGDVLLHCSRVTSLSTCPAPLSGTLGSNVAAPRGHEWLWDAVAARGFMPCWAPGQWGQPLSSCGGRQSSTTGLGHPASSGSPFPVQRGVIALGGSHLHLHLHQGFLLGGPPQNSPSQRVMVVENWIPHLSSAPATFGCPPRSPPLPAQPYPFQVELSWGEGSRGAGTGRGKQEPEEVSRVRGSRGREGGRAGIKLATKNLVD